ncbi:TetR/AcrR family transcriptional regulator [Streptomyces brasiliensis]|uniref:TetR family transcriptional regulator n=1 Tax=Streptomyces brasiliensis TaxID=1954 RepID=A0A917L2N7_9ACTN|nr:TetR/AcrR family transcriptional regulator [Streptomyces brasiliensis]GGJ39922.1 TetR family transcriptional regulator [Streptomyces brasiliensis]
MESESPQPPSGPPAAKRPRNAAATREAILRSAVEAFTRVGYDGAGVRDIAKEAGVTAMLVNRYFGSKEQLFAETVDASFAPRTVVTDDPATLSRDIAKSLVDRTGPEADHLSPFLLMLRSAPNPRTAEIARAGIERHVERELTGMLTGEQARERSALALAVIAGVWLMRKVIGDTALVEADADDLTRRLEDVLRVLLEDPEPK